MINEESNPNILSFYTNQIDTGYNKLIYMLAEEFGIKRVSDYDSVSTDINSYLVDLENKVREFLKDKKLYIFIDFQDVISTNSFKTLAETLERLPHLSKSISIIVSMNKAHALKMENVSYILGKYTPFELPHFTLEATKKLISARLKCYRSDGYVGDELSPFNNNVISIVYNHTGGIPRNILSACDLIINNLQEGEEIDEEEIPIILRKDLSKKVIYDMTDDEGERDLLMQLYSIIKTKFNGEISKEKELHKELMDKLGWSNKTSRKRIRKLNKIGLISITKGRDLWSNVIRII